MLDIDVQIKGRLYGNGHHGFSAEDVGVISDAVKSADYYRLAKLIESKDGFFLLKIVAPGVTILVSDRIRSINAGFGFFDGRWQVFFEAGEQLLSSGRYKLSKTAESEFQYTGYLLEDKTFFQDVMQMLPGQILALTDQTADKKVISYADFLPIERESVAGKDIEGCLSDLIVQTFKKSIYELLDLYPDRKFLVPLSGGYDSRFILVTLIACGVKVSNIISFTYGEASSYEVKVSQKVAESLNVQWHCVETNQEFWKKWGLAKKASFDEYTRYAAGFGSCPVYQDWPVIGELLELGVIDREVVVLPGHAGDFLAGSHLVSDLVGVASEDGIIRSIVAKHFSLKVLNSSEKAHIKALLADYKMLSIGDANASFEWWDWRERQSKLIMNSVRAYEYWGLDWWCPFWSKPFFDLFVSMPASYRQDTSAYLEAVNKLYATYAVHKEGPVKGSDRDTLKGKMVRIVKSGLPVLERLPFVLNYTRRRRYVLLRKHHPMGWNHLVEVLATPDKDFTSFYADYSEYTYKKVSDFAEHQ